MKPEESVQAEEIDQELEKLMSGDTDKKGKKKRGGKKKKIILAVVALVVLGAVGMKMMGSGKSSVMPVQVITPAKKTIQNKLTVSGPVSGTDSVDVVSNIHAEILEIPVKEGDRVEKGDILAVLDDTDIQKEMDIAKNDYDLAVTTKAEKDRDAANGYEKALQDYQTAKAAYDRTNILFAGGSVPKTELETAENAKNDAKRELDSYRLVNGQPQADDSYRLQIDKARFDYEKKVRELEDTKITSPIEGTVVRVNTKVGRFADKMENETPLFVIENLDVLEMEIQVSEYSIGKVQVGQEAVINADILNGQSVRGEVVSISPTGEIKGNGSTERVIPTTIRILDDNSKLIAGISAKAEIVLEEAEDVLSVPISALYEADGVTYVLIVRDGLIHQVPVETGVEGDIEVEIIPKEEGALDEETQVVAAPSAALTEGMAVLAMPQ